MGRRTCRACEVDVCECLHVLKKKGGPKVRRRIESLCMRLAVDKDICSLGLCCQVQTLSQRSNCMS